MPIKTKSCSYSAIGIMIVILVLTFIILTNATTYAQVFTFSNTHASTIIPTPHPLAVLEQQRMSQPNLHLVKIISLPMGQQVPVGNNLDVFGISTDNPTDSHCSVAVEVNGVGPYHNVSSAILRYLKRVVPMDSLDEDRASKHGTDIVAKVNENGSACGTVTVPFLIFQATVVSLSI